MYQVFCAACNASFEYNNEDYIHICPYCSSGFVLDYEEGTKELIGDHFVIPNRLSREKVVDIFETWIKERYHKPDRIKDEFNILGMYGICMPYWIVSLEAHSYWSGHSRKAHEYVGQRPEYSAKFVKEEGRFSRRYRWCILARKSTKEHWGLERLHHPKESVLVDWDGFPLDESMGRPPEDVVSIYQSKKPFKFEHVNGLVVSGVQLKENAAIARTKDQVVEYHRRICKTKVGTLQDHRTEVEVVGIQIMHIPFWVIRYGYAPKSAFRFLTKTRENRLIISGYTEAVLEAELPINANDRVMTNLIVCGVLSLVSLFFSMFVHSLFIIVTLVFVAVCVLSAWKIFSKNPVDHEIVKGIENNEPVT